MKSGISFKKGFRTGETSKMNITVINILDLVRRSGEESIIKYLSSFSCQRGAGEESLNPDIEDFIKNDAINFAKQKVSASHIVIDEDDGAILGYFTFTHKPLRVPASGLSNTTKRKRPRETFACKCHFPCQFFLVSPMGRLGVHGEQRQQCV